MKRIRLLNDNEDADYLVETSVQIGENYNIACKIDESKVVHKSLEDVTSALKDIKRDSLDTFLLNNSDKIAIVVSVVTYNSLLELTNFAYVESKNINEAIRKLNNIKDLEFKICEMSKDKVIEEILKI